MDNRWNIHRNTCKRFNVGEQMNIKVNASQLLQTGLWALIAWLFKTVNDLQQMAVEYQIRLNNLEAAILSAALRERELTAQLTEILIKLGG